MFEGKCRLRNLVLVLFATGIIIAPLSLGAPQSQANSAKTKIRIGIFPFVDNSGQGSPEAGAAIARALQFEIAHATQLSGRLMKIDDPMRPEEVDEEKAVATGRERNFDVVVLGTLLEASSSMSASSGRSTRIFGQTIGGNTRTAKASVVLQADLYNVSDGTRFDSIRVTGKVSDLKVGLDADTQVGSISTGGDFDNTPLGKAVKDAVAQLTKKIAANQAKMTHYEGTAAGSPAEAAAEEKAP